MGLLTDIAGFLGFENPAEAASPYLEQIPGQIKGYYEPYVQAGQAALPQLQTQLEQLLSQPGQMVNQIGGSFQQSPGLQFAIDQQVDAAKRAAAAGGMAGSPAAQWDAMQRANQLANQDYYNYLDRGIGMYGQGLAGTQQMAGQGLQAGSTLADQLANVAASQAQLAYSGAQAQNQAAGGVLGGITDILGALPFGEIGSGLSSALGLGGKKKSGSGSFGPALYPTSQGGSVGGFL